MQISNLHRLALVVDDWKSSTAKDSFHWRRRSSTVRTAETDLISMKYQKVIEQQSIFICPWVCAVSLLMMCVCVWGHLWGTTVWLPSCLFTLTVILWPPSPSPCTNSPHLVVYSISGPVEDYVGLWIMGLTYKHTIRHWPLCSTREKHFASAGPFQKHGC